MNTFVKIYGSIIRSTVWAGQPPHVKLVWITLLILADSDGRVEGSVPGLATTAGVSIRDCEEALATFMAPDKYSRTKEHEGRRLSEIPGGWLVLNHAKYRDMRTPASQKQAVRQKRYRDNLREKTVTPSPSVVERNGEHNEHNELRGETAKRNELRALRADPDLDPDLETIPSVRGGSTRAAPPEGEVVTRPSGARQHFAPDDFQPIERHVARAAEFRLDLAAELTAFREHEFERAYSDWNRTFDRWLTKAKTLAETNRFQATQRRGPGPRPNFQHQPDGEVTGWESTDEEAAAVG